MDKERSRKKTDKERFDSRVLISMLVGVGAIFFLVFFYYRLGQSRNEDDSVLQDQPFDVTIGETQYPQADLSTLTFATLPKGTQLTYRTVLKGDVAMPVIRIWSIHSITKVYLDGKLIESYGIPGQHMLGYGYLMIPLPEDYTGRELLVEQTVNESGEVGTIRSPVIYNADHYFWSQLTSRRLVLFTDTAIIMLALAIIIVGFIFIRRIPDTKNLMWMSAAFIGIGMWEFCNTNLILLFAKNDLMLKGYLEYLSLYITPIFLLMFFADDFYHNRNKKERAMFLTLLIVQLAFVVTALILHFSDIAHLPSVLLASHAVIVLTLGYILFMILRQIFRRAQEETVHKEILAGTLIMALFASADLVRFELYKFKLVNNSDYNSMILLGILAFALCMILDFFRTQQRNMHAEARGEVLEKLAYRDIMTGLYNRQKVGEIVEEIIEEKGKKCFGVLNFDLNDLKKANDAYGHPAGDKLLIDFAELLKEVFGDHGLVARMGGDEFIVIYRDIKKVDHDMLMKTLKERCDAANETRTDVKISYASGFGHPSEEELEQLSHATAEEGEKIYRSIFKRADDRMYEDKARIKSRSK